MNQFSVLKIATPLGSNVYFVGSNPAVIIDTGHPLFAAETVQFLQKTVPIENVAYILCTHCHPDHLGGASALKKVTSAQLLTFTPELNSKLTPAHQREIRLDFETPRIDCFLNETSPIELDDDTIRVIHTPGHSDDHCCFYFEKRKMLFTGDLIVNEDIGFLNLNKPYMESLREFSRSLDLCETIATRRVFSGHGDPYRVAPWNQCKRKLELFKRNPQLLIAHTLISPLLFYLWAEKEVEIENCEQYIIDHSYLFEGFLENVTVDLIVGEFRKVLMLLELRNVIVRNGKGLSTRFSRNMSHQWHK
jgi:hydroxyacylglutathione hydrolase